jgi:hypothetical protein
MIEISMAVHPSLRRAVLVAVLLPGCGRFGFEQTASDRLTGRPADAGEPDGGTALLGDAPAPDGGLTPDGATGPASVTLAFAAVPPAGYAPVDACIEPTSCTVRLDPARAQANLQIAPDGLSVYPVSGSDNDTVLASTGYTSGKWYFEVRVEVGPGGFTAAGVGTASTSLELAAGETTAGCSLRAGGEVTCNSGALRQNTGVGFFPGSVIGVAADLDMRRIYFRVDGSWLPGQDPVARTGGFAPGNPGASAFYPALTTSDGDLLAVAFGGWPD